MNEYNSERNEGIEIDFNRLVGAVWKKLPLVILASILGAGLLLAGTLLFVTPLYQSEVLFYVNNTAPVGEGLSGVSSGDLSTSRSLVDSYLVILNSRKTLKAVIADAGIALTDIQLRKQITASDVNHTEIFQVAVTSPDPNEAERIANAIARVLPERISGIIEGASVKVVDEAEAALKPTSPNYGHNTLLGFSAGFLLAVGTILWGELFALTIRTEANLQSVCKYPILAAVPELGDRSQKKRKKSGQNGKQKPVAPGEAEISFAASEAYKLLRTKLQFSFADDKGCHIIGISSALTGEGKSLSAVNLARNLAQLNRRVLLMDCDMRRPSLAEKLGLRKAPGLSSYLTGQKPLERLIQICGMPGQEAFSVIPSGRIPPNPVELLSSSKMERLLQGLREQYDVILLDLPPVGKVSDGLTLSKEVDGYILVVRQNCCSRLALKNTVQQFEFVGARILGVVYNCAEEISLGYDGRY